jgi:hypothetical protein
MLVFSPDLSLDPETLVDDWNGGHGRQQQDLPWT